MKLYQNPLSTYCKKVLYALYEKNIEFESEPVNLMDPTSNAQYREIYPMGKIPLLVLDDGHIIPESSIIIEYLDSISGPALIPNDPQAARRTRFKDRMFDNYLNNNVGLLFFQSMKPEDQRDQERIDTARRQIGVMYQFMEQEFASQPFANGDQFLMSDCAAAAALGYAEQLAPFDEHANIQSYWERLQSRESVQRVKSESEPLLAEFMQTLNSK